MRIGIISDTHDNQRNVRRAIEIFNEQAVQFVLHAGDMTGPSTASLFAGLCGSRFVAVMGNCDADRLSLRSAIEAFAGQAHESHFDGSIDGKGIYMAHIPQAVKHAVDNQAYDLVVYGHTHRQNAHRVGRTLIVNPGAARNWMGDGGCVLIVDLSDMSVTAQSL